MLPRGEARASADRHGDPARSAPRRRPARRLAVGIADRDEIERAFERLTQDQRTILTLVYFADLSLADTSIALGIPLGTTKSRLHHALNALRAAIAAAERVPELNGGLA